MLRNPSTALLLAAVLIVGAGQTVVFAVVPPISRSIGLTEVESSLIFTASAAAILLTSQLWGRLSDKFGRLPVVLFGLTCYGILLAALAYILTMGLSGAPASFIARRSACIPAPNVSWPVGSNRRQPVSASSSFHKGRASIAIRT